MPTANELQGVSVLVTGAGGGIGAAIATECAAAGARLFLADRDPSVRTLAASLSASCAVLDLADGSAATHAVQSAAKDLGSLNGIVQAAGVQVPRGPLADLSDADWHRLVSVNLTATVMVSRAAASVMINGSIVNIGSISARSGIAGIVAYSVTKAAVHQLTRSLAIELAPRIRVNAVAPGYVETPLTATLFADADRRQELERQVPLGRIGTPHEIAPAVRFLLSSDAAYITGEVLVVDGGFTAR